MAVRIVGRIERGGQWDEPDAMQANVKVGSIN